LSFSGITAVRDSISFDESGDGFIPLIGCDRDAFFEDSTWFGGGQASFVCRARLIPQGGAKFIPHLFLAESV